ncbi:MULTISPECIES: AAA family ATPase [Elizabethkingia]|uniref:AAA family ATPase n=1 Tax=Elizabethkingia TaxID=308865 RepID=UPI0020A1E3E1|nr:AAA family ATPase [Elizabethkingia sp. S0634]MCP1251626.1 AAA family ATPase [Elizabethkingia sp. S0634]
MITKINLKNYKAFEDVTIPIKPITIFLGANSVGKSSIIQLLLLLQQTGKTGLKSYKSALKLYGGYVNLGDPKNLFRKRNTEKPIEISFEIKSNEIQDFLKHNFIENYIRVFKDLPLFIPIRGFSDLRDKEIKSKSDFKIYIDTVINVLSKETTQEKINHEIVWFLNHRSNMSIPPINKSNQKTFIDIYDFLIKLNKAIRNNIFRISYNIKLKDSDTLYVSNFKILHQDEIIIELSFDENLSLRSDYINFNNEDLINIKEFIEPNSTIFNTFKLIDLRSNNLNLKSSILIQLISKVQEILKDEFSENSINYVSPLRAHPKRYYMLDKAKMNLTLDTLDGDAIAEVLKDNPIITKSVNDWFQKFGLNIDVKAFKEVIHHLMVKQNDLDLDITDVGFGISQILPVIIQGFLAKKNTTTIIEQPEIHLHPKMQADLADLFIDIIETNKGAKKLIIETHSEYLLKRLRRRISEGKIASENVSICLFNPQTEKESAKVEILEIEEKGYFEWPIDFYGGEILNDTTVFLKNQN